MCEENVKVEETVAETAENTEEVTEAVEEKANAVEIEPLFEEFVDFDTFILQRRIQMLAWMGSHQDSTPVQGYMQGYMEGTMKLVDRYLRLFA